MCSPIGETQRDRTYSPGVRAALLFSGLLAGCGRYAPGDSADLIGPADIHFLDDAATNAAPGDAILNLQFVDQAGKTVRPRDLIGAKNLVVVFTRGYNGSICPYCSSYTSSLITNYPKISERATEVLVVYPIAKPDQSQRLDEFLKATFIRSGDGMTKTPFPVVLDIELKAVDTLGIRKDLAKPATYILDKAGHVRFAYVGKSLSDRPSIKVILKQLDTLREEPG
ncbi:MAG TPA: redoxin domain-containing protein [Planctomycetaceae bacterium]|jgi:peroxiredoxin|nr:redoxin domain-containing protein [Planctomycetaceae bacterium]